MQLACLYTPRCVLCPVAFATRLSKLCPVAFVTRLSKRLACSAGDACARCLCSRLWCVPFAFAFRLFLRHAPLMCEDDALLLELCHGPDDAPVCVSGPVSQIDITDAAALAWLKTVVKFQFKVTTHLPYREIWLCQVLLIAVTDLECGVILGLAKCCWLLY